MELLCIARGPAGKSEGCDRYCSGEHLAGLLGGAKKIPHVSPLSVTILWSCFFKAGSSFPLMWCLSHSLD